MNRIAIVTGGATRIGRELSLRLAQTHCDVCVHFHSSADDADEVVRQIEELGRSAIAVQADLTQPTESAALIVDRCVEELGPASILVNNAAIFEAGSLDSTDADQWRRHLDLNLTAPLFLSQAFARQLPEGEKGNIINIVDWRSVASRSRPSRLHHQQGRTGCRNEVAGTRTRPPHSCQRHRPRCDPATAEWR